MCNGNVDIIMSDVNDTNQSKKNKLRDLILKSVCEDIYDAEKKNGGKKPYGLVKSIVDSMKSDHPWVDRHSIRYAYEKYVYGLNVARLQAERDSDAAAVAAAAGLNPGGRPKGSTLVSRREMELRLLKTKNEIAFEYSNALNDAKALGCSVRKGFMSQLIREKKIANGIAADIKIPASTIYSRAQRNRIEIFGLGPETPMRLVEPRLVDLIIRMSRIRRCLTPSQCLYLANDLIKGTEVEKKVIAYKEKQFGKIYEKADLGNRYWQSFKKRWNHRLCNKRGQKFALDRASATNYTNLAKMYDEVYDAMEECGVALKLQHPVFQDEKGNICDERSSFGLKITHDIIHPEMCLVVDEVGSNLSQKGDGHIGGQKFVCERGTIPQCKVQHKENHFTTLGFTALSGDPVLCVIVIAGKRESFGVETGIDPSAVIEGDIVDDDFFDKNYGHGKLFPSGPSCHFNDQDIPCLVRWSEKGGITSEILAECLEHIDSYNVFERTEGLSPFLLLDGHGSRFEIPFLDYITNKDHEWQVCIGVPYGTSLWQVGDSKEQNGSYKIALAKAKKTRFEKKLDMFIDPPSLERTDIIGIVNDAWAVSFERKLTNKKAICERGWGPCNRNLLKYKEIHNSMTNEERRHYEIHFGCSSPPTNMLLLQSSTSDNSLVSDITPASLTPPTVELNYSSGNSSMVLDALVAQNDLLEARERIRIKKQEGEQVSTIFDSAKALTAMVHFNEIGCKIGKSALQKKRYLADLQLNKKLEARKKEEANYLEKKRAYDNIVSLNIEDDKLNKEQLTALLNFKKRKIDKGISQLKKSDQLRLWQEWKARWDEPPVYDNQMVMSVSGNTITADITTDSTGTSDEVLVSSKVV